LKETKHWVIRLMTSEIKQTHIVSLDTYQIQNQRIYTIQFCEDICSDCQSFGMKALFINIDGHSHHYGCRDCATFFTLSETESDVGRKLNS